MSLTTTSCLLYVLVFCELETSIQGVATTDDKVKQALKYVEEMHPETCKRGTSEKIELDFDVTVWNQYAATAVWNANFLSKIIATNGGTLDSYEKTLYLIVQNNVHSQSILFGSGIAFEEGIYSKYPTYCPYAYKDNGTVKSIELSLNYDYHHPDVEFYETLKVMNLENITIVTDVVRYRDDNVSMLPEVEQVFPVVTLEDGHWTKPYYDCGGGNIWMVTYTAPILKIVNGKAVFKGASGIDIDMSSLDINQCDPDENEKGSASDVFRGSHKCLPTTKCVPVRGSGFVVGAYHCQCIDGYYFPDLSSPIKAYLGEDIEAAYRQSESLTPDMFRCTACAAGCDTCVDNSPCLFEKSQPLLVVITLLMTITAIGFLIIAIITFIYREEKAIKSASSLFLEIMCVGGILMSFEFFTVHFDPSIGMCSVRIWLLHLGFFTLYGSLVFKTWRISMIFTVGTKKKVHLPDKVLLKRLGLLLLLAFGILAAWNTSQVPSVDTLKAGNGLKFYVCAFGPWEFAVFGVETILLLYGVYLCFTVRKAPAIFNESKHITLAVYNAIILGSVVTIMMRLVTSIIGPDLILLLHFAQIHVYSTMTISFIFVPKFIAIYKKLEVEPSEPTTVSTLSSITGRIK